MVDWSQAHGEETTMSFWDMMSNEVIAFWANHKRLVMLGVAMLIVGVLLSACTGQPPRPQLDSGKIIQVVKHDDVEVKDRKCVSTKKVAYKDRGKTKTKRVCAKYKVTTREVSPEYYEFELQDGSKTGWVTVDEDTGESYEKGDQYP